MFASGSKGNSCRCPMATERVVVVGASAGGVSALEALVEGLPQDFPAPVLIVLHMAPTQRPLLAPILSAASVLPAAEAVDGEPLEAGRICVLRSTCSSGRLRITSARAQSASFLQESFRTEPSA